MPAVRAFEAAARLSSFVRAGEELFVTAGAVGHQVRLLEDWIGQPLFVRGPRSIALTDAGRLYLQQLSPLLDDLERASLAVRSGRDPAEVTVTAMPSFVTRWLMPRLGDFRRKHPQVEVRLLASVPPVDFVSEPVDVAIRLGRGPYPGLLTQCLLPETFRAVARPDLCAQLNTPQDLLSITLLHDEYEARIPEQIDWPRWCVAQGMRRPDMRVRQGSHFSHTYLTLDAAAAGEGVAVASDVLAGDAVRRGILAIAPGEPVPGPYSYHLLTTRAAAERSAVSALCAWLRAEAQAFSESAWASPT